MLCGKGPSAAGFQILFKSAGFFFRCEGDAGFDTPGGKRRSMRNLSTVVTRKTIGQIFRKARVMMGFCGNILQEVDVIVFRHINLLDTKKPPEMAARNVFLNAALKRCWVEEKPASARWGELRRGIFFCWGKKKWRRETCKTQTVSHPRKTPGFNDRMSAMPETLPAA